LSEYTIELEETPKEDNFFIVGEYENLSSTRI